MESPAKPHLLHVFPSFAVGGSQRRFADLVRLLAGRYRHTVIALDGNFEMSARLPAEADVQLVRTPVKKSRYFEGVPAIRRALRGFRPNVLVTYNWGSIDWALANRWRPIARHIHVEDGFGPEERSRQLQRRVLARRVALSGSHTRIVVPSLELFRIARAVWRLDPQSVLHIPNGIDCERFAPSTEKPSKPEIIIGTIAALRPEKNIARLVESFARMTRKTSAPKSRLLIFGEGSERARLGSLVQSLGIEKLVEFRGETSRPEVALSEMDVFALTSDTEQMPLSVLEAMAAGLPIAAVAVGDVAAMLSAENRPFATKRDDGAAFVNSLHVLASDPVLRTRLGEANRQAALARFDINLMAARYRELFG